MFHQVAECIEYLHLNWRGVLEFVYEQITVRLRDLAGYVFIHHKQTHVLLHIVVVEQILVALELGEILFPALCKVENQTDILFLPVVDHLTCP